MHKPKSNKNPSFSSTLLDQIYHSMDDKSNPPEQKQSISNGRPKASSTVEDDMKRNKTGRTWPGKSSGDSSSFGWYDYESHKPSCFVPFSRPKPEHRQTELETNRIDFIKSKARAFKIYANLKKVTVKQPISPGARLTTFLTSLFANAHLKKPRFGDKDKETTCSSASSFTRSCLSKNSPRSRNNGIRRTVRFYPVSIIIDQDSRPCGEKFIDDSASDSSSDLFELDHCGELPVYETTHFVPMR